MILVKDKIKKIQKNFWNNCLFHPTDAVEDSWGKRILDTMSLDKSIQTVRIYTMFEDIVLMDENGNLTYDFRVNDLRLDYLAEKGYDVLLAYGMMPECIATNKNALSNASKNKTRYKGKLINTSTPVDYKLWEDICYEYTKHIVERYGIETVSKWHLQCLNEPDNLQFFMSYLPLSVMDKRVEEYGKLYKAFANGILRVSDKLCFGGPALAGIRDFLRGFLNYVKENNLRMDFISLHNYADNIDVEALKKGERKFCVNDWLKVHEDYFEIIKEYGFSDKELIIDEWGMAAFGFFNMEECPCFISRECEVFSSYYVKLIKKIIEKNWQISKLIICLSGQHEMITDFSGFRNFFTLNFFKKPIYNAFILASKLHSNILESETDNENIFVIPSKNDKNEYAVLLTYSSDYFEEDLPLIKKEIKFEGDIKGKTITVFCIDKNTTNPYRLYEKKGLTDLSVEDISKLRNEGNLKPISIYKSIQKIELALSANSVYMIIVK